MGYVTDCHPAAYRFVVMVFPVAGAMNYSVGVDTSEAQDKNKGDDHGPLRPSESFNCLEDLRLHKQVGFKFTMIGSNLIEMRGIISVT